jgi:hypothetical protein
MNRHELLSELHERLAPRSYLEIGINDGRGLARSRTRTIGVDPDFKVRVDLACDLQLVKATSDDFFARPEPIAWFPDGVIDLAFIDGMHLFEYALRDFINTERLCGPASVIVLDDMLPRSNEEAARDRHTVFWTGDVFKVAAVLAKYRPELVVVPLDTEPTGLLLVAGLDPTSTVLADAYDAILAEFGAEDPQVVPEEILHRKAAADPDRLAGAAAWADLAAARAGDGNGLASVADLATLRGTSTFVWTEPENTPMPAQTPKPAAKPKPKSETAAKTAAKAKTTPAPAPGGWTVTRVREAIRRRLP